MDRATAPRSHIAHVPEAGTAVPEDAVVTWRDYLAANAEAAVGWAAVTLIALAVVLRGWAAGRGWLFYDDLGWQGVAATHRWPDLDLLTTPWNGHAMPAGWLVAWAFTKVAPLQMWPIVASSMLLLAAYGWLLFLVLRRLFGSRPEILLLLTIGMLSTFTLPATLWWAVQLAQLPLLVAATAAVWAHLGWLRWRRGRDIALVVAALCGGLLFSERALLILPLLALLTLGWFSGPGGWWTTLGRALRLHLRLWLVLAVVAGGFLAWYVSAIPSPASPGGDVSLLLSVYAETLTWALAPALLGGPWVWLPIDPVASVANLGPWLRLLSAVALAVLVLASCIVRRHAARAWWLLALFLGVGAVMLTGTRAAVIGAISGREFRYYTELALILPLAIGLATLPLRWRVAGAESLQLQPRAFPPPVRQTAWPWRPYAGWLAARPVAWVAGACALFLLSSTVTLIGNDRNWHTNPGRNYVAVARAELAAQPGVHLADGHVPAIVAPAFGGAQTLMSHVFRPVTSPGRFLTSGAAGDELRVLDDHGRMRPVGVVGPRAGTGPVPGCGWLVQRRPVTIPLQSGTYPGTWLARIGYYTNKDAPSAVRASQTTVPVLFRGGLHVLFVVVNGGIGSVTVGPMPPGPGVCVTDVAVGWAQAQP